jgi:hypothetical protein
VSTFYTTNGGGNFYVQFSYGPAIAPPMCECGNAPIAKQVNYSDGRPAKLVCAGCGDREVRESYIRLAESWLTAAFSAVQPAHRARLYKSLATTFHPDAGGDARLMTALNAVRERFP